MFSNNVLQNIFVQKQISMTMPFYNSGVASIDNWKGEYSYISVQRP